jgi:hypothetical protein
LLSVAFHKKFKVRLLQRINFAKAAPHAARRTQHARPLAE